MTLFHFFFFFYDTQSSERGAKAQIREVIETHSTLCQVSSYLSDDERVRFRKMSSSLRLLSKRSTVVEKYAWNLNVWPVSCRNDTLVFCTPPYVNRLCYRVVSRAQTGRQNITSRQPNTRFDPTNENIIPIVRFHT